MPLDFYRNLQLRLAITNDISLAISLTRIDQKEILMQLGHQSNSYDLMHMQESQLRFKDKKTQGQWLDALWLSFLLLGVSLLGWCWLLWLLEFWRCDLTQKCKYETLNIMCNA
jgi:hypothetical protein